MFWLAAAPAEPAATPAAPAPTGSDKLDFDLFGDAGKVTPAADNDLTEAVTERRRKLQLHQVIGLSTLGLMAVTEVLGQLNYDDIYGGGGGRTGNFLIPHRVGVVMTTVGFATTAYFGLAAPKPYDLPAGLDSATIHKVVVTTASIGMVAQLGLGFLTARQADAGNPHNLRQYAAVHKLIGYSTLACLAAAAVVFVF